MAWRVPLADVDFNQNEYDAVLDVLKSGWLTMGAKTQMFEEAFAKYLGAKHAFAVTNCTAGLHLALAALNVGPGDEVIVPSLTFVATSNAVLYSGATPVFADITSLEDLTISPEAIEKLITERTKAIIIMHYGGYACDLTAIMAIAKKHNLKVVEDTAHAVGASFDGKKLGCWGDLGCFSFFPNKNMTTAEGGMVITNSDALAEKIVLLRSHGMTSMTWDRHKGHASSYDVVELGFNYRIDEIRSALGLAQLEKLADNNALRIQLTEAYRSMIEENVPEITVPFASYRGISSCHILPVLLPAEADRGKFMNEMKSRGIQTSIHYPPIHQFTYYRNQVSKKTNLPITEIAASREVTLPLYPKLSLDDIEYVAISAKESISISMQ